MEIITSLENTKVKYWNKLNQKKFRDEENLFIVEGEHLVNEAIKSGYVKELILQEDKIFPTNLPFSVVTEEIMKKISQLESPSNIIAICKKIEEKELGNRILLLDAIQDPGNLGTIIRSALAFNIDTIVLGDNTVDLYNEKVIRSSQGMLFHLNILTHNLNDLILDLKKENYQILGTSLENGINIKKIEIPTKYAIIMGNEGNGVCEELIKLCDKNIFIPMAKTCESLNVAIAASIIMYEMMENNDE